MDSSGEKVIILHMRFYIGYISLQKTCSYGKNLTHVNYTNGFARVLISYGCLTIGSESAFLSQVSIYSHKWSRSSYNYTTLFSKAVVIKGI